MTYATGIDIGSVAAKLVIVNDRREILAYRFTETIPDIDHLGERLFRDGLETADLSKEDISYIVSTGYGRYRASFADENRTEILCHAAGVHHEFPSVRTIIDIGGQDSKAIILNEEGRVINYAMNSRCAAGTGRFTEVMARALKIDLKQWGEVVRSAEERTKISNTCTVFAESEVISKIMQKIPLSSILAGVCEAIATRVMETVRRATGSAGLVTDVAFTGGVANNLGVRQLLEEKLGTPLLIPETPQRTGALGAALMAISLTETVQAS
jgi:(R)-2-hydroxyacyl-CoA dehydratese activating ATPase